MKKMVDKCKGCHWQAVGIKVCVGREECYVDDHRSIWRPEYCVIVKEEEPYAEAE